MRRIDPEPLSVWWADVKLEKIRDGKCYISEDSFKRPVVFIDNKAYFVFKITSRERDGYVIKDLSEAGLMKRSIIRTDVIVPISRGDLIRRLGQLSERDSLGLLEYLYDAQTPRMMGEDG